MSSFDQSGRASVFLSQAEKTLKKFSLFGSGTKYEDAAELYTKAGNCFKVSGDFGSAGDAYCLAAGLYETKLSSGHEASSSLLDAGNCYKEVNPQQAIGVFRRAVGHWTEAGRFNQAAKITKNIGEMYEKDGSAGEVSDMYIWITYPFD